MQPETLKINHTTSHHTPYPYPPHHTFTSHSNPLTPHTYYTPHTLILQTPNTPLPRAIPKPFCVPHPPNHPLSPHHTVIPHITLPHTTHTLTPHSSPRARQVCGNETPIHPPCLILGASDHTTFDNQPTIISKP